MTASLIYLIDNTLDGQGASPRELRAVLSRVAEGAEILTEPYHAVSLKRLKSLNPSHIVLSGQSHPWDRYAPEALAGVIEVIKQAPQPTLGVCGGHQQSIVADGDRRLQWFSRLVIHNECAAITAERECFYSWWAGHGNASRGRGRTTGHGCQNRGR